MAKEGKTGITANTPKNIPFGAGTIHKNLTYGYVLLTAQPSDWSTNYTSYYTRTGSAEPYTYTPVSGATAPAWAANTYYAPAWNFSESLIGATSGGSKLTITPEIYDIPADGAWVKTKGLRKKTGETATMELNFIELTKDLIKSAVIGVEGTSADAAYDVIESKVDIETGDYLTNIAFVGKNLEGKNIIVIMDNALCTSGLALEGKDKEAGVAAYTFECHADLTSDLDTLPYHIYYPVATA